MNIIKYYVIPVLALLAIIGLSFIAFFTFCEMLATWHYHEFISPLMLEQPLNSPLSLIPIPAQINRLSKVFNFDAGIALKIAQCESGLNPAAIHAKSTATGLFQFTAGTWQSTRKAMGLSADLSLRLNATENIRTAVWKLSKQGTTAWTASQHCWKA